MVHLTQLLLRLIQNYREMGGKYMVGTKEEIKMALDEEQFDDEHAENGRQYLLRTILWVLDILGSLIVFFIYFLKKLNCMLINLREYKNAVFLILSIMPGKITFV